MAEFKECETVFQAMDDPAHGAKPKVYKDGQYSDPLFKKLSKINGEVNKLTKVELQSKLKEFGLDTRGLKDVLRKRLKNYYKKRNLQKSHMKITGKTGYDYLAVIDFEATCEMNNPHYRHEIIEFPIVLVDVDQMKIVDRFHEYVRPQLNPTLSNFCTKLTGITQAQVDKADTFVPVLERVELWLQSQRLGQEKSFAVLTDGPWDMFRFMYYQCQESSVEMPAWSRVWINIRKSYCNFYQCGRGGIETMLKNLGMQFEGSLHSGIDDSVNIARIAIKLLNDGCCLTLNEQIQIKENPHDNKREVRYTMYQEPRERRCIKTDSDSDNDGENGRRRSNGNHSDGNRGNISRSGQIEVEGWGECDGLEGRLGNMNVKEDDGDVDDLLNYYRLQKT
ncbi:3'-5' exoribonuclease 1-like [Mya arenaria]|uniref:3'-5' exoribonuclease 1-like n=1 Tax=Mya arenaria TaxID=6604 RepID=UPI0022E89ECE|nr:3'-5' exoribonuclease 1-like [Mya arenaria]